MKHTITLCLALLLVDILAGAVCAAEPLTPPRAAVVGFAGDENPVDLSPRLTPRPERSAAWPNRGWS